jgi:hypothetical protein
MPESDGLNRRYPDPNRPLTPAWLGGIGEVSRDSRGSFWTRGLPGKDRGPQYQGGLVTPGVSLLKTVAIELLLTLKAAVIWTLGWTVVGIGILYGLMGLIALAN